MVGGCEAQTDERVVDLVVPVTVQPVARGTIESFVSTTGSLRASRSADILVEVRGDLFYVEGVNRKKPVEGPALMEATASHASRVRNMSMVFGCSHGN